MAGNGKPPVLVILQLTGGNDYFNPLIPYNDGNYYDMRPSLQVPQDRVLKLDNTLGMHPAMGPMKEIYDSGDMAIIHGIGYANSPRSHFRSMDIWHTCEPTKIGDEGWLGRVVRDLDPQGENVLTAVNFGRGLPRALVAPGVAAASVGNLETYGVLTGIDDTDQRLKALDVFTKVYAPMIGTGPVMDYLAHTGLDALKGADILSSAPEMYSSTVEYGSDTVSQYMRNIVQTHLAGFGTRVLYTTAPFNSFDTHAGELAAHTRLWSETSRAVGDFYDDLKEHNAGENVMLMVFSEFGRRVKDNGSGTDHGAGGHCFIIGDQVKGGLYGEYPSLDADKLDDGDLQHNNDFRGVYSTILEKWMGLDAKPIVGGEFEQLAFI